MDTELYEKDPDDVATYDIDWTAWLAGRTPAATNWTASGLTVVSTAFTGGVASISLSGGANETTYTITCQMVTSTGSESVSIRVRVVDSHLSTNTFAVMISQVRGVLSDRRDPYRYMDDDLLGYANDALAVLANARPQLFTTTVQYTCVEGAVQRLQSASTLAISTIEGLRPTTRDLLDRIDPDWTFATSAAPRHWAAYENDPRRFYVQPPAVQGAQLLVSVAIAPDRYSLGDNFPVLKTFWPAVIDYVVGMAESRDDEHVLNQRAVQFLSKAASMMGVNNG